MQWRCMLWKRPVRDLPHVEVGTTYGVITRIINCLINYLL